MVQVIPQDLVGELLQRVKMVDHSEDKEVDVICNHLIKLLEIIAMNMIYKIRHRL